MLLKFKLQGKIQKQNIYFSAMVKARKSMATNKVDDEYVEDSATAQLHPQEQPSNGPEQPRTAWDRVRDWNREKKKRRIIDDECVEDSATAQLHPQEQPSNGPEQPRTGWGRVKGWDRERSWDQSFRTDWAQVRLRDRALDPTNEDVTPTDNEDVGDVEDSATAQPHPQDQPSNQLK